MKRGGATIVGSVVQDYFWEASPIQNIVIGCGVCGTRRGFSSLGTDGAIRAGRRMGWRVEFMPKVRGGVSVPLIRCPEHKEPTK